MALTANEERKKDFVKNFGEVWEIRAATRDIPEKSAKWLADI